jgi:Tol biopolymer transport system component
VLWASVALVTTAIGLGFGIWALIAAPNERVGSGAAANGMIAFVRDASGEHAQIWTAQPDGTGIEPFPGLSGYSVNPSWSPDGQRLVFTALPEGGVLTPDGGPRASLYVINADGSDLHRLTVCEQPPCWGDDDPTWSPDGRTIAFLHNDDIYSIELDGTDLRRLTHSTTPLGVGQPAWSPDGQRIAFIVLRAPPDNLPMIELVNSDGGGITRLARCSPVCSQPAWSPDGSTLLFNHNGDVAAMSVDGSDLRTLIDCEHIADCVSAGTPVWSPDGAQIVFSVQGRDNDRQLYVMNADGSEPHPLIRKVSDDCCMAWQPLLPS